MSVLKKVRSSLSDILKYHNPLNNRRQKKLHDEVKNTSPSLIAGNCLGGMLLHDLGLRFNSPTVNIHFYQRELVKFVLDLDRYLNESLEFYDDPDSEWPVNALLGGKDGIRLGFAHITLPKEGLRNWSKRKERFNYDNIFVIAEEKEGMTKQDILSLGELKVKGIVVFTAHEYPEIPYTFCVPSKYVENGEVGNIMKFKHIDGSHIYDDFIDWPKWFNEADGGDYDITPFIKKKYRKK